MRRSGNAAIIAVAFMVLGVWTLTGGSGDAHAVLICANIYYAAYLILRELEERR